MDKGSFRNGSLQEGRPNLGRIFMVALQVASALSYMHVRVSPFQFDMAKVLRLHSGTASGVCPLVPLSS